MMKQLLAILVAFIVFAMVPGVVLAQTATPTPTPKPSAQSSTAPVATTQSSMQWGDDLRHAYTPAMVNNNQWVRARINNITGVSESNPVCVEAFQGAAKTHLGCLTVPWRDANWMQEFDAPLSMLGSGTYSIHYTYKKQDGSWVGIKTHDNMMTWPTVMK